MESVRYKHLLLAGMTLLMPAMDVSAQSFRDSVELEPIVVTASHTPKALKDAPVVTRLITLHDIKITDATNIQDLLIQEIVDLVILQLGAVERRVAGLAMEQVGEVETLPLGHRLLVDIGLLGLDVTRHDELGVTDYIPKEVGRYVFEGLRERELVYVFETVYDGEVRPAAEELAGGAFFSPSSIKERIGTGFFTDKFVILLRSCSNH